MKGLLAEKKIQVGEVEVFSGCTTFENKKASQDLQNAKKKLVT